MAILLWGVLALVVGIAFIWVMARRAMTPVPPLPPNVELPATPLQRTARWSLGLGVSLSACAAGMLVAYGPETIDANDGIRMVFTLLLLTVVVTLSGTSIWLRARANRDPSLLDERDRAIRDRAPAVQSTTTLLTLAFGTTGLVMHFHDAGAVPINYLFLLFWACLVMNVLGLPLGILIGYRRP